MADIREAGTAFTQTATTVTTTTETVAITSPFIDVPAPQVTAVILGWAQLTTGTGTTTVTPRIRRGAAIASPLVGGANAEGIKAAVGSVEPFIEMVNEFLSGVDQVQYSFTLQQAGATANGSILMACILVLLM